MRDLIENISLLHFVFLFISIIILLCLLLSRIGIRRLAGLGQRVTLYSINIEIILSLISLYILRLEYSASGILLIEQLTQE
jgi:hypothetical protein